MRKVLIGFGGAVAPTKSGTSGTSGTEGLADQLNQVRTQLDAARDHARKEEDVTTLVCDDIDKALSYVESALNNLSS